MHVTPHTSFISLSDDELRSHEEVFDLLIYGHFNQRHLLCMPPGLVSRLRELINFGPTSRKTLDILLRRSQDYFSSLRASARRCVILPLGFQGALATPSEFFMRAEDVLASLDRSPALFVENFNSDGLFYRLLFSVVIAGKYRSDNYTLLRPYHGGGNPLGDVIVADYGGRAAGVCICDRDKGGLVPPFKGHSTSARAASSLQGAAILNGDLSSSDRNAFFYFAVTTGWARENYVGPHLLDFFFSIEQIFGDFRERFVNCFPSYPDLSQDDMTKWWLVDFRDAGQNADALRVDAAARFPHLQVDDEIAKALADLVMPPGIVTSLNVALRAGAHQTRMKRAISSDLLIEEYRDRLFTHATAFHANLAADKGIRMS